MKKLLAVVLTAALTVGMLAGCGGSDNGGSSSGSDAGSAKTAKVIDVDLTSEEYAFGVDKSPGLSGAAGAVPG